MKTLRPCLLAFTALCLLFGGCSARRPEGVSESLVSFRPTEASLLETRGVLTVRYTSENISPLGYSGSKHKLYLNGTYVGNAVSDKAFGIPPLTSVTQEITVQLENTALVQQLLTLGDHQTVSYRLESVLFQTVDEDKYEMKLKSEGVVDLHGVAQALK
jgi:LEA14-like dessication related protein